LLTERSYIVDSPATTTVRKKSHVLINRNFTLLWIGQTISFTGDFVFDTVLVFWIATSVAKGQTWAPLAVSGVVCMAALPAFIIAPIAGVLVDSWDDKRKTMLFMHGIGIVLILLLFPLTGLVPLPLLAPGPLPIWWKLTAIYTVALLIGTMAQFFNPAEVALLSDIVEEPERTRATGLHSLMLNLATLLGPTVGAVLYFALGVQSVLLLNMLSFAVAFLAILAIHIPYPRGKAVGAVACPHPPSLPHDAGGDKPPPLRSGKTSQSGGFWHDLIEGLRFFKDSRILVTLIVSGVLLEFGVTMRNTLGVFFIVQNLHADASLYGLVGTAFGLGLIVGAATTSYIVQRIGRTRTYWFSTLALGALTIIYARLTNYTPALVLMFLQGLLNSSGEVIMITLVIQVASRDFVGRVLSVFTLVYGLVWLVSTLLAGYLVSDVLRSLHIVFVGMVFGPIDTIFTAVGLLTIIGGFYAMVTLRKTP
jgi:MFS family permease